MVGKRCFGNIVVADNASHEVNGVDIHATQPWRLQMPDDPCDLNVGIVAVSYTHQTLPPILLV